MGTRNSGQTIRRDWVCAPLLLLGVAGILWFSAVLPAIRSVASVQDVTERILTGDRFKSGALSGLLARTTVQPRLIVTPSEFVRAEALIKLRAAEETIERKHPEEVERDIQIATDNVRSALSVNPTDAFLWLMLYSAEISREGFDLANVRYLERSYVIAPLEGWIALRRNRIGLAIFQVLTEEAKQNVISEFVALVNSGFIDDAAKSLDGWGWVERERLLTSLERANMMPREVFARKLARDGVKVSVPGVDTDQKPWR